MSTLVNPHSKQQSRFRADAVMGEVQALRVIAASNQLAISSTATETEKSRVDLVALKEAAATLVSRLNDAIKRIEAIEDKMGGTKG